MNGIADYRFLDELGTGSYGRWYRAPRPSRLPGRDDFVAVKVLDRRVTDAEFARVAEELSLLAALDSPYLVRVYDVGFSDGVLYYAAEHHPEGSLEPPATPPTPEGIAQAVADAARGAHALHEVGVVHRDIKPPNVLLKGGRGRLSDLGLTALLAPGMTTTGVAQSGTVEFLDPSTLSGTRASRLTDIWSLGLTLHRALSGQSAYPDAPGGDVMAALRQMLAGRPELSNDLPAGYRSVIERCITPERARRFATAAALADAIEAVSQAEAPAPVPG